MKFLRFSFALSLFIEIMMGAEAWFIWPLETGIISKLLQIIILGIAVIYKLSAKIKLTHNAYVFSAFVLFSIGVLLTQPKGIMFIVGLVCRLYPLWVLISDKDFSYFFKFSQKILTFFLIPGLLIHIVLVLYQDLPGFLYNKYYIYVFAIRPVFSYDDYIRFQSVFMEPSYLGTLMAFLLYADKYDFNKLSNKIFLVSLLASLSLAGLVLSALGYAICAFSKRMSFVGLIPFVFIMCISYLIAVNYSDGNNVINERVVKRLQRDEDGGISGNNRFTSATDDYYKLLISNGGILMGLGPDTVDKINGGSVTNNSYDDSIAGAGYKIYIITYGLLSALFFFFFYLCLSKLGKNKLYRNGFVIMVFLTFIQAAYPQSFSWIIPFIFGIKTDRDIYRNQFINVKT